MSTPREVRLDNPEDDVYVYEITATFAAKYPLGDGVHEGAIRRIVQDRTTTLKIHSLRVLHEPLDTETRWPDLSG